MRTLILAFLVLVCGYDSFAEQGKEEQAMSLIRQGKSSEAVTLLKDTISRTPATDPYLHLLLGYALFRQGDFDQAETVLRRALKDFGPQGDLYRLLAQIAYRRGELRAALEELDRALVLDPADPEALTLRDKIGKEWAVEEGMRNNYGGNFTVTFEGGGEKLGQEALAVLEDAYVELGLLFDCWPEEKTVVILYGNRDFKSVTGAPDWSGGLYDGKIRVPVGGLQEMNNHLRRVIYHEFAHVLIRRLSGSRIPLWLNEGLAQWAEERRPPSPSPRLRDLVATGKSLPFSRFDRTLDGLSRDEVALAYEQSLSLTSFLIEQWGMAQLQLVLRRIGEGLPFETAAQSLLHPWGGTTAGMIDEWRRSFLSH